MWNCVKRIVWATGSMFCLFAAGITIAQTVPDTASLVATTDNSYKAIPQGRPGKPFYDILNPTKEGLRPVVLYSSDDRLYAGVCYNRFGPNWKPDSAGSKQKVWLRYSFNQNAFSIGYQAIVNHLIGNWNLYADAGYDWVKWTNFYGLGNETVQQTDNADYYRIRSREAFVGLSFQHKLGKQSSFTLTPFYQQVQLLRNPERYFSQSVFAEKAPDIYNAKNFGGLRADLLLQRLDDVLLPTKGVVVSTGVARVQSLGQFKVFTNYNAGVRVFLPFLNHFVLSVENSAATVTGNPEFYQLNSIGGSTLRGYRRERFWGETVFHNNNELQYLFDAPFKFVKGKMGFLAFADQGRVWKKGEQSDAWHYGYGGGVLVVPHHKIYLSAQYGISNERQGFHFTVRRLL